MELPIDLTVWDNIKDIYYNAICSVPKDVCTGKYYTFHIPIGHCLTQRLTKDELLSYIISKIRETTFNRNKE